MQTVKREKREKREEREKRKRQGKGWVVEGAKRAFPSFPPKR
jgi:hypothetical protein